MHSVPEPAVIDPPDLVAARRREAATREILEAISQYRDDDRPVFEAVLRNSAILCDTSRASLDIISEDRSHATVVAHWGENIADLLPVGTTIWWLSTDHAPSTCMREGRIVHVADMADTDLYRAGDERRVLAVNVEGIRTFLAVPLLSAGQTIGCIEVFRREVRPFSDDEIALLETFAAQAVIAIENVRQFRELQDRLEREAATRNILRIISESPDDEQPTFEAILDSATRLCGTPYASLVLGRSGDATQRMVAHRGAMDETLALFRDGKVPMNPEDSMGARAILEGRTIHVPDMADTDQYRAGHPRFRLVVDQQGLRTNLFVPLLGPDGGIGCFILWKKEAAPFTADQIALVETFASHAVIAIENVRQFRELQERLAREAATREILEVISTSRDDERPVFDAILRNATKLCGAKLGALNIGRRGDAHVVMAATLGWDEGLREQLRTAPIPMDPGQSFAARSILDGTVIHLPDLMTADLYVDGRRVPRLMVDQFGLRSMLLVPLMHGDEAIGTIGLHRVEPEPFTPSQIDLVQSFAAQAVIAIENVRQFRAIQTANEELQTRLAREAAMRDILDVISRNPEDEAPVFATILRRASELCDTPAASFTLAKAGDTHQRLAAHHGFDPETVALYERGEVRLDPDESFAARAILSGEVVHLEDMMDTDNYRRGVRLTVSAVQNSGIRTIMFVPLMTSAGCIGSFDLFRREVRPYTEDEISLVRTFAAQAAIAIENVRQFKALEQLNGELGNRVQAQVGEIERMGRLKRFLPAAVADAVVSSGSEKMLKSHRALLGVLFCDIRGFTSFCETAEPEETIDVLQTYHDEMGRLIEAHGAGVDHRMGDGIMVLFNDPIPCDDPAGAAVRLGVAMRARMAELSARWKKMGYRLGFGVGISLGYATVGMVGSGGRFDYTASGTAINLAERLCGEALDGEILISQRAATAVEDQWAVEPRGERMVKGIREAVAVYNVTGPVD